MSAALHVIIIIDIANKTCLRFSAIRGSTPSYPSTFSKEVRNFIHSLLNKDPSKRLGTRGVKKVMKHKFFKAIDWKDLKKKKVAVPYLPRVTSDHDVSNFSEEFTETPGENEAEDDSRLPACDDNQSRIIRTTHKYFEVYLSLFYYFFNTFLLIVYLVLLMKVKYALGIMIKNKLSLPQCT